MLIISLTYINLPNLIQKRKDILIFVRRAPIYHSQQHYLRESRTIRQLSRHHSCNNQHHMCQYSPYFGFVICFFLQQRICIRSLFRIRGKPSNGRTMQNAAIDIVSHCHLLQGSSFGGFN